MGALARDGLEPGSSVTSYIKTIDLEYINIGMTPLLARVHDFIIHLLSQQPPTMLRLPEKLQAASPFLSLTSDKYPCTYTAFPISP